MADVKLHNGRALGLVQVEMCQTFQTLRCNNVAIYALLTKREVKMAGYWPSSFFAFLWTETKSRSIKTQKKNEANIQPS